MWLRGARLLLLPLLSFYFYSVPSFFSFIIFVACLTSVWSPIPVLSILLLRLEFCATRNKSSQDFTLPANTYGPRDIVWRALCITYLKMQFSRPCRHLPGHTDSGDVSAGNRKVNTLAHDSGSLQQAHGE